MNLESQIKQKGIELGFDRVGITTAAPLEAAAAAYYQQWLDEGRAAGMGYLHRNNDKRFAPAALLEGAQSVICVALNYRPGKGELPEDVPLTVARYALYEDYHGFIKARLFDLAAFIQSLFPERRLGFKACVDSAPLAERALAQRAGLGFIGRNHMLIHPDLGGQLLLGELLTTLPLEVDKPLSDNPCPDCGQCIAACPTGALSRDGTFDARKCLSYLTIEEQGNIPETLAAHLDGCLFGCDKCLLACPFEKDAPPRTNLQWPFHPDWAALAVEAILNWTEANFEARFKGSCLERLGLKRLQRNARLCQKT